MDKKRNNENIIIILNLIIKNNDDKDYNKIGNICGREKLLGQHPLCEQAIDSTPSAKTREKKKS